MNLGTAIKRLRKEAGMNQQELTSKAGISQTALSQIENGVKAPNSTTLEKICNALEIPISILYIMAMDENDVPENKKEEYKRIFPYVEQMVLSLTKNT